MSRQFTCMYSNSKTIFIKNDVNTEINFDGNSKKELCFCFLVYEIKLTFWYCGFLGRWEKLYREECYLSLLSSFSLLIGPLVLLKETYSCNVLQGGRCTVTKHEKPSLHPFCKQIKRTQ